VHRRTSRKDKEVARSIKDFGFVLPILVDAQLTIVARQGRWAAAKLLGYSEVPVIRVEYLSDAQLKLLKRPRPGQLNECRSPGVVSRQRMSGSWV